MKDTHLLTLEDFFSKYAGTPYKDMDCWQLVSVFYKEVLGVDLPNLYSFITRPTNDIDANKIVNETISNYTKVEVPRFGDVMLINIKKLPCHVAVYLDRTLLIHSTRDQGVCVDKIFRWQKRTQGYYRC